MKLTRYTPLKGKLGQLNTADAHLENHKTNTGNQRYFFSCAKV